MVIDPVRIKIVTPRAASYLWRISDARLRRLALDGELPFRTLRNWGGKPTRAFYFDACRDRWGSPDPDRLTLLMTVTSYNLGTGRATVWEILTPRPSVEDDAGRLAFE